jgi:molybdopterin-guanine dinucleotide biosynthesis protein A
MKEPRHRIRNISAAILAGGRSRRMGKAKALLPYRGRPLVTPVYETLLTVFEDIFLVTNDPGLFDFLPCPKIPDRIPGKGPVSGLDAALRYSRNPHVLVVACDAPFLSPSLLKLLTEKAVEADLVIPYGPNGPEPLCAVYGKGCLPPIEDSLRKGDFKLVELATRLPAREISLDEVAAVDPGFRSFRNINTPEEYQTLTGEEP